MVELRWSIIMLQCPTPIFYMGLRKHDTRILSLSDRFFVLLLCLYREPTFSRNTSLLVNLLTAIKESCTIPMTGLFDCGVTMFLGTIMISVISARASRDCGTCKFISSPSKSALYGVVTLNKIQRWTGANK